MAKTQAIGVDIDGNFLKIAIASLTNGKLTVELLRTHYISAPLESARSSRRGIGGGSGNKRPSKKNQSDFWQEVSEILDNMITSLETSGGSLKMKRRYVGGAVSMMDVVQREVVFSGSMTDREIVSNLPVRMKSQLSEPLDDMYYDFEIEKLKDGSKQATVLAASKSKYQDFIHSLELAGLEPITLDIEGRMNYQFYDSAKSKLEKNSIFLDLKDQTANIYLFSNSEMVFFKELSVAIPDDIRQVIADSIATDNFAQISSIIQADRSLQDSFENYQDSLVSTLQTELRLFSALHDGYEPSQLIYYGTGALLTDIHHALAEHLEVKKIHSKLLPKVNFGRFINKSDLKISSGYYSQAIGLANRACQGVINV